MGDIVADLERLGFDTSAPASPFPDVLRDVLGALHRDLDRQREEAVDEFLRGRTPHEWGRVRVLEYGGPPVFGGPGGGVVYELWIGPRVTPVADMTSAELGQWFTRTLAVWRELNR